MTLRVMTWNIKTGARDARHGDRLDAVLEVVAGEGPDILALQELRDFDRHGARRLGALADAVGMRAHLAPSLLGQPVAVLVRPPVRIVGTDTVRLRLHHAAAAVVVPTDRGAMTVVSTHLNPFSPQRRMREARWLAARYARPAHLVLLAGDLNGLDPWSEHGDRLARLAPLYRRRHLRPDGRVDTRAVAAFVAAGLTDLWRAVGHGAGLTAPTGSGGREFSGMRLDYLLASEPLTQVARQCRVVRGGAAEYASDHYPVWVDLALSAA